MEQQPKDPEQIQNSGGAVPAAVPEATASSLKSRRRRWLGIIAGGVAAIGVAYGAYWAGHLRYLETTDDAYVGGNVVQITPQIAGTVVSIAADDTAFVKAGQTLVQLDRADAQVALEQAEAQLGRAVREVRSLFATSASLKAAVDGRASDFSKVTEDLSRRERLAASGAISKEEVQHARDAVRSAQSALEAAQQELAANRARVDRTTVESHPDVRSAAARVHDAYLTSARTALPAPVSGYVAKRGVQLGQRVTPGMPLMAVVPLDQVWIDANFKEAQLAGMRVGQPVTLKADIYGGKVVFHGRIAGFGAGTGAAFALLPAQNATGNWIKIVQRVPVRIALDQRELAAHPLQIGLSMQVEVDTHERTGDRLPEVAHSAVYSTEVFRSIEDLANARVKAVIAANDAGAAPRPVAGPSDTQAARPNRLAHLGEPAQAQRAGRHAITGGEFDVKTQEAARTDTAAGAASAPLTGGTLVAGTIALSLATFMNVLDTSIANVSIPAIAGDLGVSPDQATWVITSFGVANAISLPLTGWLTQRFGQVRLFMTSVLLFVLASLLCGFAPSLGWLILFRVLQGAVAGPMIPLSQSLLLSSYPREKAGTALAMWAITTLVAPVVGPLLGGFITDNISWPWIFYINIPVGIAAAAATWMIYARRETPTRRLPIDAVGLALLVIWVGALQVMLDKGKDLDWFHSGQIVILAVTAAVGFMLFIAWELTDEHPVVDLRLLGRRNFWTGTLALSLGYGVYFGNLVLLPLWLQQYMGYTATLAGMVLAPVGLLAILLTPIVGRTLDRVDPRIFATASFSVFALVLYMRAQFNTTADFGTLMVPTLIQGAAMAVFFVPLITMAMSGLAPDRIPAASGLINFVRITAGSFGTSIATTWWDRRASLHHAQLAEHITIYNPPPALADLQAQGYTLEQGGAMLNRLIDQQAFMLSFNDIFLVSSAIMLLLIGVVWLARPVRGTARTGGAAGAH